jgi:chromosome partitioning protein
MNESTFPGTEPFSGQSSGQFPGHLSAHLPTPQPTQPISAPPGSEHSTTEYSATEHSTPYNTENNTQYTGERSTQYSTQSGIEPTITEPSNEPSTAPRPAPPARALPDNYAEMPKPTAKLTAEDLAPVNDANGPRNKIGPTGRPLPDLPEPKPPMKTGPAQVIAMCNQKGGVGKTTTTINLGAAIAETGRKVLLIDFDPQGSASIGLGVQPHDLELSVYNLLMQRDITPDEVIRPTRVENLDLLPANIDLSAAEVQLVQEVAREYTLQRVLDPIIPFYDVILIDCAPSLGLLTVNALTASNGIVVPLECEFFALRGLAMLTDTISKVQDRLNPKLEIVGILGTMFDGRTTHAREVLDRVVQAFDERVFHTVIRRTVKFPETTVVGEPITTYAPSSQAAMQYRDLAKEVLARCPAG